MQLPPAWFVLVCLPVREKGLQGAAPLLSHYRQCRRPASRAGGLQHINTYKYIYRFWLCGKMALFRPAPKSKQTPIIRAKQAICFFLKIGVWYPKFRAAKYPKFRALVPKVSGSGTQSFGLGVVLYFLCNMCFVCQS